MKKNIALLAGGFTGEYEVSINSAKNIAANLDRDLYNVYPVYINENSWFYENEANNIDKNDFSLTLNGEKIKFDFAFITVHGTPGEDGKIQGYLDMLNIPYNTCDATVSAITMNKAFTKVLVNDIPGLHTANSICLLKNDPMDVYVSVIGTKLKLPLFIKPNNGGSSVGMSKIHEITELDAALKKAFNESGQVLVEEFIKGREFSIGVVKLNGEIKVLPATEIIFSKDFFDYEAKYLSNDTREVTPAEISSEKNKEIADIVTKVYQLLNCRGMVRIDFILQENTHEFHFIEINTTPGQSSTSLIPQQVKAAGMDIKEFYGALIEEYI